MKRTIWFLCVTATICIIAFCAWHLYQQDRKYKDARNEYEKLKESVLEDEPVGGSSVGTDEPEATEKTGLKKNDTDTGEKTDSIPQVDFNELKKINSDVVGWLYFPGQEGRWREISYPVLHGDTNEEYLHTTVTGDGNFAGSLFTDERNKEGFSEYHTIIYGHTMKDGSMFGQLKFVRSSQTVQDPRFWIITEDFIYEYTIYCLREVSASNEDAYMVYPSYCDAYAEFVRNEHSQSEKEFAQPQIGKDSRTVTLSTCVGTGEDGERLVIRGLLTNTIENI